MRTLTGRESTPSGLAGSVGCIVGGIVGMGPAEPAKPCRHIIMMDISGSLRNPRLRHPPGMDPDFARTVGQTVCPR